MFQGSNNLSDIFSLITFCAKEHLKISIYTSAMDSQGRAANGFLSAFNVPWPQQTLLCP